MIKQFMPRTIEGLKKIPLSLKIHRKKEEIKFKIKYLFQCKHDFQPIVLAKVTTDESGKDIYTYRMQCMKCGKNSHFYQNFNEKQEIVLPYKEQKILSKFEKGDLLDIITWDGPNYCIWFCKRENGKIYGLERDSREVVAVEELNIAALIQNDHFSEYIKHSYEVVNSREFKALIDEIERIL